jgi:hypothetical protein
MFYYAECRYVECFVTAKVTNASAMDKL